MINALTIDVEDYFHTEAVSSVIRRDQWREMPSRIEVSAVALMELLDHHKVTATLFVLGWVAERFPGLLRQAVAAGHEIGCHSYWHQPIFNLTPEQFEEDTKRAKCVIEDAVGMEIRGYRAPSFSLVKGTEWASEILVEQGFVYDSSINPIHHDFYSNAGAPRHPHLLGPGALWELPISTVRIAGQNLPMGGGAYLRIFPLRYMRWGLNRLNKREGNRAVFYVHPWELDAKQPRIKLSRKSELRQYSNLHVMGTKLDAILSEFKFASVLTAFPELFSGIKPLSRD